MLVRNKFCATEKGCKVFIHKLELFVLGKHKGCVNTVHFSPTGNPLGSRSNDMEIIIWDWAALRSYLFILVIETMFSRLEPCLSQIIVVLQMNKLWRKP